MFDKDFIFSIDKINNKIRLTGFRKNKDKNYLVMTKDELKEIIPNSEYYSVELLEESLNKREDCDVINLTSLSIEKISN